MTTPGLYDSMTIGTAIELLGQPGGTPSMIPELVNAAGQAAVFQLLAPPQGGGSGLSYGMSYDLGAPQPTTDIVQSLLLDGERPFGYRASNREIHLPVKITAPDIPTMNAAREFLMATVDKQAWELAWTPVTTGLPLVFDCFRALPTVITYGFLMNQQPVTVITLHFQALPYGRSDPNGLQQVAFASPLLGGIAAPPAPVVLDNFGTVSGANWTASTQKYVTGPTSAHWTPPAAAWGSACTYSRGGLGSLNISGLPVLSVWAGLTYDTAHFGPWPAMTVNLTLAWVLTDNGGHTIDFSRTYNRQRWANNAANPSWVRHTANIPQGVPGFNYNAISSYSVRISNFTYKGTTVLIRLHAWLDNIVANPPSLSVPASQRGTIYTIMGAAGTARTPFSCQFQLPQAGPVQTELTGAGAWWPPLGVTTVQAEAIGGGGAGSSRTTAGQGGGEYATEASLTVVPGNRIPFTIGSPGSGAGNLPGYGTIQQRNGNTTTFGSPLTTTVAVVAHGGLTGLLGGTTGGAGGSGSANTTHSNGGTGGTAPNAGGGGGGGSGGTAAAGNTGGAASGNTGGTGASAVAGGGAGGAGSPANGWPGYASAPGGGGGGGFSTSYNGGGGNGATGQVRVTYIVASGNPVNGGSTTFGSAGTTGTVVTAHGGGSAAIGNNGAAGASGGAGAAAVAGGGKGANGATAADTPGQSNSPPGGGGGGAYMNTAAQPGGTGGAGSIVLTWTPPLAPFGTLIAHRPGPDAPENLNPCVPVYPADNPDGRQYTVPQVISGVNSLYRGTYSVVLMNFTWDNPSAVRQVTLSVYQYEYANGPVWTTQLTRSITPSTDITNGLIVMGEVTLPVKDMDPSNTSAYYAVSVTDTDQADQFLDVLFLDTQGQTVIVNIPPGNAYVNFLVDEPTSDRDLGRIMGSNLDRSQAISCLDSCIVSGGPLYLNPGDNTFLCYSPSGAPNLAVSYLPRWYSDRLV